MRRIKVLMCCSDVDSVRGGMVTVVKNYLTCRNWKNVELSFIPTHREGNRLIKSLYFAVAYLRVAARLLEKKVDLVHLHVAERGSFYRKAYLVRLCRRLGIPVVLHHHAAEFEEFYAGLNDRQKEYVKEILEAADRNLVLSVFLKRKILEKAPGAKVEILRNAVATEKRYLYRGDKPRIVMLGRIGERKGSYDLLTAVAQIRDRLPRDTELWLCGDGETQKARRLAAELHIEDMIAHVGWISGRELHACLKDAAIHVLPSYREGLPMSILETMGMGIPNISTRIASIPEVIRDGETGFLLEPGDIVGLKTAILKLLSDKELRQEISRRSYDLIIEEFSLEASVAKLERLYIDILGNYRRLKG